MALLKNLSIRTKLFLISIIPSLGLLYVLQTSVSDALADKRITIEVYEGCEEVERISGVIHALQTERGLILRYLATNLLADKREIIEQEAITDQSILAVKEIYAKHDKKSTILKSLDSLEFFRQHLEIYPDKVNNLKSHLLKELYLTSHASENTEIKRLLETHILLLYTKEFFSRTRNILLPVFIKKEFGKGQFAYFNQRKAQYDLSREQFLNSASKDVLEFYNRSLNKPAVVESHAMFETLFRNPEILKQSVPDPEQWWITATVGVNAYSDVERYSLKKIRLSAEGQLAAINTKLLSSLIFGMVILLAITILLFLTIRDIVAAIAELKRAAQKLAQGEVDFTVNVTSRDEMGDLAASFNKMVAVKKQYAQTAEKIGKGDYTAPVLVRTNADILGIALTNMKEDLQRLSKENSARTWLLEGNSKLNDQMRGDKELGVLSDEVIGQLTEYVNAQIGALYVRENGHLALSGKYAFDFGAEHQNIALGQGFVGQAAVDAKPIVFNDVPENYIRINSALGDSKPRNIIVYPFLYEGEVKAVAEIGTTGEFSDLHLEFLRLVGNNIGIAVNASQSRQRLKNLLEETQRQSEELETQQEELKQFNEELLEKTRLLESSEEELKAQQEELQQSNEELLEKAALLEEQKEKLEYTKIQIEIKARELELASQYKSEFLSNMSHELRTPLNSILILAQVLSENRNKALGQKEIKFANTIYNSGNDLLSLINEILDLSKIEAGKMELDITSFTLRPLVQNIANAFEELGKSKGLKFSIRCPEKLKEKVLTSDHQRIEQIIKNFLSNAFKFTEADGKIDFVIKYPVNGVPFRKKTLHQAKDVIGFVVSDTGIGIPKQKLDIIFDAFQQVDGSTKRKYGGTGLGLSISRELAHLLGGEIHVQSAVGKGSTFTLYLPAEIQGAEVQDPQEIMLPVAQSNGKAKAETVELPLTDASYFDDQHLITENDRKILIMEDDVEFSKLLLDFVHERNYKGIVAHQGNIGLSYARHYKPDAIILDMKLPVVDGTEVLKKLKSDPDLRHIPVQIISGHDHKKRALELGAIDFIKKPVSRESFWKALDKVEHFVSRKPKKLLIIEDDEQHNAAVKELIGNGDVKCYSAYSGKEAYEILSKDAFDCIIIDLGLPDMTGFKFLEKIRETKELNKIPVIVYTGKDLSREENSQLEKLASTVVLKTAFSHERLLDETTLFLHRVEAKLPRDKQNIIRKLHRTDEVLRNKKVLIADDDSRNLYSLISALEPEGMICHKAVNGKEALEVLKENDSIDIVLMDVMMPEMDGFEATKAIRQMNAFKKTPVIALTAKAMKGDREKCLAAGMSDYISKPVNVQQLLSLMRVWLYA